MKKKDPVTAEPNCPAQPGREVVGSMETVGLAAPAFNQMWHKYSGISPAG
jgi:hypothetical protein